MLEAQGNHSKKWERVEKKGDGLATPQDTSCTFGRKEPLAVVVETWTPVSGKKVKEDGSTNEESR